MKGRLIDLRESPRRKLRPALMHQITKFAAIRCQISLPLFHYLPDSGRPLRRHGDYSEVRV